MKKEHRLYLASPLCFYTNGYSMWNSYKLEAEFNGFTVTMPNGNQLVKEGETVTPKEMSDRIFKNCLWGMKDLDGIIVNLETYRGSEPDGGSIYELGLAYGNNARCYGFTRDKRTLGVKYQAARYNKEVTGAYDVCGNNLGYHKLPFSVCVVGSTKIIEGDFSNCLKVYMTDLEEERKNKAVRGYKVTRDPLEVTINKTRPVVYVATNDRDNEGVEERYEELRKILNDKGFDAYFPTDKANGVEEIDTDDIYTRAYNVFDCYTQHVRNCDIVLLDINDYRGGYEPSSDVAFEAGYAYALGKKLYGFMDDISPMTERIPGLPDGDSVRDFNGMSIENFTDPLNLMFGASVTLLEGNIKDAVIQLIEKEQNR